MDYHTAVEIVNESIIDDLKDRTDVDLIDWYVADELSVFDAEQSELHGHYNLVIPKVGDVVMTLANTNDVGGMSWEEIFLPYDSDIVTNNAIRLIYESHGN